MAEVKTRGTAVLRHAVRPRPDAQDRNRRVPPPPMSQIKTRVSERSIEPQLLSRYVPVCEAIHYAHRRGVISPWATSSQPTLCSAPMARPSADWGLAKRAPARPARMQCRKPISSRLRTPPSGDAVQATAGGSHLGTPAFMSPGAGPWGRPDVVGIKLAIFTARMQRSIAFLTGHCKLPAGTGLPELQHSRVIRGDLPVPRASQLGDIIRPSTRCASRRWHIGPKTASYVSASSARRGHRAAGWLTSP